MDRGVGTILRQTRNRRQIELEEVEVATRIRPRFLRAIENEEWDVLPGGVYTRGFIRAYAGFLGLDGERLAEDYRASVEGAPTVPVPLVQRGAEPAGRRRSASLRVPLAVAAVVAVAAVAIVAFPSGGEESGQRNGGPPAPHEGAQFRSAQPPPRRGVSVSLAAGAEVWVCVLDASGEPVVDGQILEAGAEEGPFHSGSFTLSFGNGEVSMLIDGREADIPQTSSPIGFAVDSSGTLTELDETERPTCL